MKIQLHARTLILLGAAAALLACGKEQAAANDSANAASTAPATAENATAATANANTASAAPGAVNADFLVGKWSAIAEDCKNTVEIRKDGTAVTPIGEAKWTLTGDKLQFDYSDGSKQPPSTVRALGKDRIEFTRDSGSKDTEKRC
jgi:phosphate-selective porin